ncbi:hypothetical protein M196_gp26 [Halorubrum tailed virus 4]|uniref:Uncharacterized protein n=1 Tax=Halorubrum tailed virus 4 TaxID=1273752 RepID=R4T8C5_9CAUD|nr:hypothetical protein M196_gp26 [Halorubrum tailed virus 4]AGM11120.1 hypothetical protein HRTV4_26 [Halorubrum tailed virus 4]
MTDTTTIEVTTEQKAALNSMGYGSYKAALQRLIDSYNEGDGGELLTDAQRGEAREIALDVVNDRVVRDALE